MCLLEKHTQPTKYGPTIDVPRVRKELCGCEHHLPMNGFDERVIDLYNIMGERVLTTVVFALPGDFNRQNYEAGSRKRRHRLRALCPGCRFYVPLGRLIQHLRFCKGN